MAQIGKAKFHPGHIIEEHVKVYLRLNAEGTAWEIDPINDDGFPLDGLNNGPQPKESDCECENKQQCWEAHNHAAYNVERPTGKELFDMMAQYYAQYNIKWPLA